MYNLEMLPLVELHLHLDGAITPDIAKNLAQIQHIEIDACVPLERQLSVSEDCESLNEFLDCFKLPVSLLQTPEAMELAVLLVAEQLQKEQVMYAELRFAPQLHTQKKMTQEDAICAALKGVQRSPIPLNLILCCMRGADNKQENLETIRLAKKYLTDTGGVVAVDLAGAEALYPTKDYKDVFAEARKHKIPFTIHAGEAAGADSVAYALAFGAARIGHGVRCISDGQILEQLKKKQTCLELCPTSNLLTHAVERSQVYPIMQFLEQGVRVTLCTDDAAICRTSLRKEYEAMCGQYHLTDRQVALLIENGIDAAFTTDTVKQELKRKLYKIVQN